MVYFVGNKERKIVKVGYTNDLNKRIRSLQTACPYKLTLFFAIEGTVEKERYLHGVFEDYRLKGEWFELEGLVKVFIDSKGKTIVGEDCIFSLMNDKNKILFQYKILNIKRDYIDIELAKKYHSPENIKKAVLHARWLENQFKKELLETK